MLKKLVLFCCVVFSAQSAQKMTLNQYSSLNKGEIFAALNDLGFPIVPNGKCNLNILCKNTTNCNSVAVAIVAAPDAATVSNALSLSCLALCTETTQCSAQQLKTVQDWLYNQEVNRQKVKKRTYKQQSAHLNRELDQARASLDAINVRLEQYLQGIGVAPDVNPDQNTKINANIDQLFHDARSLRQQAQRLTDDIANKNQEIDDLRRDGDINRQRILDLETDVGNKQREIDQLNLSIDDLRRQFNELMDSTIDLEVIVNDFGLSLNGYSGQIRIMNGELAEKIAQLRIITDRMRQDITEQSATQRERYNQLIQRLDESTQSLNEQIRQTQADYNSMRDILGQMRQ